MFQQTFDPRESLSGRGVESYMGSIDAMMQKLLVNSIAMKAPLSESGSVRLVDGGKRLTCSFWCPGHKALSALAVAQILFEKSLFVGSFPPAYHPFL